MELRGDPPLAPTLISQVSLTEAPWQDPWTTASRARRFALGLVVPAVAVILVAAPLILSIYGSEYEENAVFSLRAFAFAVLPWCFFSISLSFLRAHDRHLAVAGCSAAFAVAGLAGAVAGALLSDLNGLSLGWLVGTALVAVGIEIWVHSSMRDLGRAGGAQPAPGPAAPTRSTSINSFSWGGCTGAAPRRWRGGSHTTQRSAGSRRRAPRQAKGSTCSRSTRPTPSSEALVALPSRPTRT